MSVPAASSVAGGVPTTFVCILKRWIWLRLVLVSHQFLLPASDRLTNCKVGQTLLSLLCVNFFFSPPVSPVAPSPRASKKPKRRMEDISGWLEGSLTLLAVDLADLWPVHRPRVVSVRSGLQQACSRKFETGKLFMSKRSTP